MDNCLMVCKNLMWSLGVPFTRSFLKEKLLTHPEPESLLAISDTLAEYKLESLALQLGEDKLDQLPLPCVVQVSQNHYPYFTCLSQVSEEWVEYLDEKEKLLKQSRNPKSKPCRTGQKRSRLPILLRFLSMAMNCLPPTR
jgi:ABC-type bacteriocin/lantibiotic exporter with double-glycine peptidase domain